VRRFVLLGLLLATADARAGRVETYLDVVPPWIQATIIGKPVAPLEDTLLFAEDDIVVPAIKIRTEPEPLTLVLVVSGLEIWIGDDDLGEEPNYPGALKSLEAAIDTAELKKLGPRGSKVTIVTYSSGSEVKLPLTDLANLSGSALGTQRDYYGKIGDDLVQGLTMGLDQLAASDTPRKVMIVIGDGEDTNDDAAVSKLPELAARAEAERVEVYALIYKTQVSGDHNVIRRLVDDAKVVGPQGDLAGELREIAKRVGLRYAATFNAKELTWDGLRHRFTVHAGASDMVGSVVLPVWERPMVWWKAPWRWAVIGVGVVALVALSLLLRSRLRAASA
jgi:von Willebrand factor type A domain